MGAMQVISAFGIAAEQKSDRDNHFGRLICCNYERHQ